MPLCERNFRLIDRRLKWAWPAAPNDTMLNIICCNGLDPDRQFERAEITIRKGDFGTYMHTGWNLPSSVPEDLPLLFKCREEFADGSVNEFEVSQAGKPQCIVWTAAPVRDTPGFTRVTVRYPAGLSGVYPEGMLFFQLKRNGREVARFPLPRPESDTQTFWYETPAGAGQIQLVLDHEKQFAGNRYRVESCFRLQYKT
nr:hypothetical protein [uncultured Oscillibacter sp.]